MYYLITPKQKRYTDLQSEKQAYICNNNKTRFSPTIPHPVQLITLPPLFVGRTIVCLLFVCVQTKHFDECTFDFSFIQLEIITRLAPWQTYLVRCSENTDQSVDVKITSMNSRGSWRSWICMLLFFQVVFVLHVSTLTSKCAKFPYCNNIWLVQL